MELLIIILVVAAVLAIVAGVLFVVAKRRSAALRDHFGPEYDRTVAETGSRRASEAELRRRQKQRNELDIRELSPADRNRFQASWDQVQRGFVDDPNRALHDADRLVVDIMRTRGYPVDDFDRRAEDISVDHPEVVLHYRAARSVHDGSITGPVDTERQRLAVTSYRSLVHALLGSSQQSDTPEQPGMQQQPGMPNQEQIR